MRASEPEQHGGIEEGRGGKMVVAWVNGAEQSAGYRQIRPRLRN